MFKNQLQINSIQLSCYYISKCIQMQILFHSKKVGNKKFIKDYSIKNFCLIESIVKVICF